MSAESPRKPNFKMADDFEDEILKQRKQLQTTIFDLAFSPCGNYLAACNNFGKIALFSVTSALEPVASIDNRLPLFSFQAHNGPIYCLLSTEKFFNQNSDPTWTHIPPASNPFDVPETNALVLHKQSNCLYSGGGDAKIHIWDMETGTLKNSLQGHKDYIHCLSLRQKHNQCISGSEDGTVRLWDCRSPGGMVNKLEPFKEEAVCRPSYGNWISCLALDDQEDWMVCGGGPYMSVWRLNSLAYTCALQTPKSSAQTVIFHDGTVISAGTEAVLCHWSVNGDCKSQVTCSADSIFSIRINQSSPDKKVLVACGSSSLIDVYTNFGYKAFSLTFV